MKEHSDKTVVQAEAMAALAELIWIDPQNGMKLAEKGAFKLVAEAMGRLGTVAKVQQMG
eukprot:CAMPEP_0197453732 /NCGR_PEP_ID=MMETSP1175-20131217/35862_1 /TAXON_ID=1003142 /ORGANISM="Triceratium dubium, Strain CCMP147" /LENGTH=58 /DNA_ID=CAMNT_0042987109 /DNA_START=1 /DNA_END=173 /DNA_ORIENTATION=+